jgi:hypothetical protein
VPPDVRQIDMTATRLIADKAEERQRSADPEIHTQDVRFFGGVSDKWHA